MNKDILFIIVIFILIILGIYFVFLSGGTSMSPAFNTLSNIKSDTQIDFSSIQKKNFIYKFESGDNQNISGMGFFVFGITNDSADKVIKYFEDNGFKIDFFETSDNLSGIAYCSKGKDVCMLETFVLKDEQGLPQASNKLSVDISCGELAN